MRKLFFFCIFSLLAVIANAQDKIITVNKDTIECRIVSVGNERINYALKSANGYLLGQFIPIEQVLSYSYLPKSNSNSFSRRPERPWLFRFNPGGSWMPWLLEDVEDTPNYRKKLSKGFHLNASGHYLFASFWGVGIQYSFFHSKTDGEFPLGYNNIYIIASEKEKQYMNYIGPSMIFRHFLDKNKKFQLSGTLSGGMIFYRIEEQLSFMFPDSYSSTYSKSTINTLNTGSTFGATFGFSAEYYISPSISIGVGGDFLFGLLKEVDVKQKDSNKNSNTFKDAKLDNALKISRVDYSLGLSFYF